MKFNKYIVEENEAERLLTIYADSEKVPYKEIQAIRKFYTWLAKEGRKHQLVKKTKVPPFHTGGRASKTKVNIFA